VPATTPFCVRPTSSTSERAEIGDLHARQAISSSRLAGLIPGESVLRMRRCQPRGGLHPMRMTSTTSEARRDRSVLEAIACDVLHEKGKRRLRDAVDGDDVIVANRRAACASRERRRAVALPATAAAAP